MNTTSLAKGLLVSAAMVAGSAVVSVPAFAADEVNVSRGATIPGPGLAVHGYDVVSYHTAGAPQIGDAEHSHVFEGATYRFASRENLREFKKDPARYAPAFGGFCAYGVALGKKFDGDPNYWKVVDGRLYLNLNAQIQKKWSRNIEREIKKANANWAEIESTAVEDL